MQQKSISRRVPNSIRVLPPFTPQFITLINKYQSIDSLAKHWLDSSAMSTHREDKLTRCPGSDVGIAVDFNVTFNVVFGGHIWGIAAEGTGPIASLIYTDEIDSEVVWEFHIGPVDHLEIVGLEFSISL
jgi:hypothetical protein